MDAHRTATSLRPLILGKWRALVLLALALAVSLVLSIGTVLETKSGPLMLAWVALWALGAGSLGTRLRTWLWPALCPVAMLVLVWTYGPAAWASMYVFMLGVIFTIAASIGALIGSALGKRRRPAS